MCFLTNAGCAMPVLRSCPRAQRSRREGGQKTGAVCWRLAAAVRPWAAAFEESFEHVVVIRLKPLGAFFYSTNERRVNKTDVSRRGPRVTYHAFTVCASKKPHDGVGPTH